MSTKFPRSWFAISDWMALHSEGNFTMGLEFTVFFYDEARVNVNNEFLGMLGIISKVKTAEFKDKN